MKDFDTQAEQYLKNKQKGGDHIVATKPEAIYALSDFASRMVQETKENLGADIRNKLSPMKNLCAMLESPDVDICSEFIQKEIQNVKRCIDILSKIDK
jgi:hypothetical protein